MDLVLASALLVLAAPLMLLTSWAIRLTSPGPIIFKQTRVGLKGRTFSCYKFRTMVQDADPQVHREYVSAFVQGRLQPSRGTGASSPGDYKLTSDSRITPLGRFLRRSSLDELPQLINVIKGEMSLIGPRPDVPYSVALYQDWHKARLTVRPGITGLWQIEGRSRVPFEEMMRLDCEYVARQSLWLDLKILSLTLPAVLAMKGAV